MQVQVLDGGEKCQAEQKKGLRFEMENPTSGMEDAE
jgi:hypothetical protein